MEWTFLYKRSKKVYKIFKPFFKDIEHRLMNYNDPYEVRNKWNEPVILCLTYLRELLDHGPVTSITVERS